MDANDSVAPHQGTGFFFSRQAAVVLPLGLASVSESSVKCGSQYARHVVSSKWWEFRCTENQDNVPPRSLGSAEVPQFLADSTDPPSRFHVFSASKNLSQPHRNGRRSRAAVDRNRRSRYRTAWRDRIPRVPCRQRVGARRKLRR